MITVFGRIHKFSNIFRNVCGRPISASFQKSLSVLLRDLDYEKMNDFRAEVW